MTHDELDEERRLLARCTIDGRSVWWCIHTLTTVRGRASARLPCRCHLEQAGEDVLAKLGEGCHDPRCGNEMDGLVRGRGKKVRSDRGCVQRGAIDESVSHVQTQSRIILEEGCPLSPSASRRPPPPSGEGTGDRRQQEREVIRLQDTHAIARRAEGPAY